MGAQTKSDGENVCFLFGQTSLVANVSRGDVGLTLANVGATLETDVGQRRQDNAHLLRADIAHQRWPDIEPTLAS